MYRYVCYCGVMQYDRTQEELHLQAWERSKTLEYYRRLQECTLAEYTRCMQQHASNEVAVKHAMSAAASASDTADWGPIVQQYEEGRRVHVRASLLQVVAKDAEAMLVLAKQLFDKTPITLV